MSSPEFEVFSYEVRVIDAMQIEAALEVGEEERAPIPVLLLDLDTNTQAAGVMLDLFAQAAKEESIELFFEPHVLPPSPFARTEAVHQHVPEILFTIPVAQQGQQDVPVPALAFRLPVDDFGMFMRLATESEFLGVCVAMSPDWLEVAEEPEAPVLTLSYDPRYLAWIELQAWRNALAQDKPNCYQPTLPLN